MPYHPDTVSSFYDQYGEREWNRLDSSAHARLIFHLHTHFYQPYIGPGRQVLDAGCGAGRFSIHIAQAGSSVTLLDLSPNQLALAREHVKTAGVEGRCAGFVVTDISDLSTLADETFDTVVCYGAPLNYLFDRAPQALRELARVTRPGGQVLVSVSSRWGALRFAAAHERLDAQDFFGRPDYWMIDQVVNTGNLDAMPEVAHPPRHFFTPDELQALLQDAGLRDVAVATAPSFSSGLYARLDLIEQNDAAWQTLLRLEEQAYRRPGLLETGEFLLAKGRKPDASSNQPV